MYAIYLSAALMSAASVVTWLTTKTVGELGAIGLAVAEKPSTWEPASAARSDVTRLIVTAFRLGSASNNVTMPP